MVCRSLLSAVVSFCFVCGILCVFAVVVPPFVVVCLFLSFFYDLIGLQLFALFVCGCFVVCSVLFLLLFVAVLCLFCCCVLFAIVRVCLG